MAHADSPTKTCGEDGCCRPLRARGLCSTHYNQQHQRERHRKIVVLCGWCRAPCDKALDASRGYAERFCSLACRDAQRRKARNDRLLPVVFTGVVRRQPERPAPAPTPHASKRWVAGWCVECGDPFVTQDYTITARFCSRRCLRRSAKRERRATGSFTRTQLIALFLLFDRCCAYCGVRVDGQPEPDHVVPLSRRGHNTIGNILPACRMCNADKRDLLLSEWNADRARRNLPLRIVTWSADDQRYAHLTAQRHCPTWRV